MVWLRNYKAVQEYQKACKQTGIHPSTKKAKKLEKSKRKKKKGTAYIKEKDKDFYLQYIKSKEWREFRQIALKHYNYCCAACNAKENLEVHHIHYETLGNESVEDVQILCENCHKKLHDINKEFLNRYYKRGKR